MTSPSEEPACTQRAAALPPKTATVRAPHRAQRFLDAAQAIIIEKGSTDFTVQEVVDRSRQSLRSFYLQFDGKHELLLALFEDALSRSADQIRAATSSQKDPLERLKVAVTLLFESSRPDPTAKRPLFTDFAPRLLVSHPSEVNIAHAPLLTLLTELMEAASEAGQLREGINPKRMAAMTMQTVMFVSQHSGDGDDGAATELEGRNQRLEYHRVFGGQLLGQFIRIASATFPAKDVKSQHTVFTREGRADEPVRYQATRQHEGRSFATVAITARQSRVAVATSSICMRAPENGRERQTVDEVPAVVAPDHEVSLDLIRWETRATVDLNASTTGPAAVRGMDAHAGRRPGAGTRPRCLCHGSDAHRNRAAAHGRCRPAWQRHGVHLRCHVPHRLVSPTLPHRRLATAPAQPTAGAWPQPWPRLRADRRRHARR